MATAKEFVEKAWSQKGTTESGENITKYGEWFGLNGEPWCAIFVCWCFDQVGMGSVMPKTASAAAFAYYAEKNGKGTFHAQGSSYQPKMGDLFIKAYNGSDFSNNGHIGICYSDASGGKFTSIEGNSSNRVNSQTLNVSDYCYVTPPFSGSSNVQYTAFPRYELSESAIKDIATCITGEQGGDDVMACRQEASQIANLNEVTYGRSNTEDNVLKTLHGGWYSSDSWSRDCTQAAIDAVKFVLCEGKRVLPRYVTEHDMFPLDAAISGHWNNGNSEDRSQYKSHETTITQNPGRFKGGGASYTFYTFFGSNKDKDVAGYYPKDYEKYKSDVPWTEGADSNGGAAAEKEYHFEDTNEKIPIHPLLFDLPPINDVPDDFNIFIYSVSLGETFNVTSYMGKVEWHNSIDEIATSMSLAIAKPQQEWQKFYVPEMGDIVRLYTNTEVFRGIIKDVDDSEEFEKKYTIYDAGWYLNKNEDTYQFKNITVRECITKILGDLSIPIDSISGLTPAGDELDAATVSDMYLDKKLSEIIKDFMDNKLEAWFNFDFTPKGFRLYVVGTEQAWPEFRVSSNSKLLSSIEYRGKDTHTLSIDESKTAVKVISDTDVLATVRSDAQYERHGFIQEVIQVNPDELQEDAEAYALGKLNELHGPTEQYSFEMVEALNSYTRAGQAIVLSNYFFIITNTDHTVEKGMHKTKLVVERIERIADESTDATIKTDQG